ncbi:MAG TPA: hypothetical protein PLL20_11585 [Phycisphaerae bacterium]|nr:hypothetical protein [Phycisphaerae bacterium]HRR84246.1 hypothetical protein [Phycisphaerae bacterium]
MLRKTIKYGVIGLTGLLVTAGVLFGTDLGSYLWTSTRTVRTAVRDSVPIEFELQRARDLLEDIIPEMQANVGLIAKEEVEIANLKEEIQRGQASLAEEKARITKLGDTLKAQQVRYVFGGLEYTHDQVKAELARAFDRYKEAEVVLAGKQRLLDTRQKSLQAAMQMLERTRSEKARLEDRIAALDSQHRLLKAASTTSQVRVDNSKLAQTEKLIGDIKKRLDVAERVLAHEAQFVRPIEIDVISEKDLLAQVEEHFSGKPAQVGAAAAEATSPIAMGQAGARTPTP